MAIYPFVKTGINLEDNMFREISQTQEKKKKPKWFHLYKESKIVKITEAEHRMLVARC